MREYCAWAGEWEDEKEHDTCVCKECTVCGEEFEKVKKKGKLIFKDRLECKVHNSCWFHKECKEMHFDQECEEVE